MVGDAALEPERGVPLKAVVVSPHLDDAVLSCGQMMAGRPATTVLTVCAGVPEDGFVSQYDADSGFASSRTAMLARRREDKAALLPLGARHVWLNFMEGAYPGPPEREEVCAGIGQALRNLRPEAVFFPAGIVHPVHELVAAACRDLLRTVAFPEAWVYEELPYRVLWPEEARDAIHGWFDTGLTGLDFAGDGPMEAKEAAVAEYRSQLWSLERNGGLHCLFVPERFWRLA
jgi:LmbE family N-acetylglucosaminyl deacetylase